MNFYYASKQEQKPICVKCAGRLDTTALASTYDICLLQGNEGINCDEREDPIIKA